MTHPTSPEEEVERLAENYSAGADGYSEFWGPVLRPVGRRLIDALPWNNVARVLDVGTGPGMLLGHMRQRAPSATVIGVDRALGMVVRASRVHRGVALMDAMRLGFSAGTFDLAVMAFVLFHLPEPHAALAEIKRVLRAGGAVAVATWGHDPEPRARELWNQELDAWGAWDPSPQVDRKETTDTPEKLATLVAAAGLVPQRVWIERVEYQWQPAEFIGLRTTFGVTSRRLQTLEPARRNAFLAHIREQMHRLDADAFAYRSEAVCAVAVA